MNVAYVGNFEPPHSTENDVRSALVNTGNTVTPLQEQSVSWPGLPARVKDHDLLLWTRTPGLDSDTLEQQRNALDRITIPKVCYHLDLFWGLTARNDREAWVREHPYFQSTDIVFSTDGGHDDLWEGAGVEHVWFPPAVAQHHTETEGKRSSQFKAQIGFVGSWKDYHPEWTHRRQLVTWTQQRYRQRFRAWQGNVRGQDLADLYATVLVLLGDSCMLGPKYWSDRIPETLGRGGFLLHADTPGLRDHYPEGTLVTWPLGDFKELRFLLDHYLQHGDERDAIAQAGRQHVKNHHTYELRMGRMVETLQNKGLL